ncbi:uncharacterized protein LOC129765758 [Toxorhynchites rutilus septentrionalis]|uniref:uncharacterized protein LOC129765758 n=1 Tax=Toxorhynchites rutilus septentrionalis TaxID=329112 RepID=UPI002479A2BF|nr:uncharacterized protein LOC129765758 [Toxorhynchites rutilus septentrionalis]
MINMDRQDVKARYAEKIKKFCFGYDPYQWMQHEYSKSALPKNVTYYDLVEYLVNRESPYTRKCFKAFKSLDAYKNFKAGWVQFLGSRYVDSGFCIVFAQVKHSQKFNLKPTSTWVSVDPTGTVQTAHCNCMAGLGEVCSHVGSVLFALECWSRKEVNENEPSCTDILNRWLVPPKKAVNCGEIKDIFSQKDQPVSRYDFQIPECPAKELNVFIRKLIDNGENPSVGQFMENTRKHSNVNSSLCDIDLYPNMLKILFCQFFDPNLRGKSLNELREIGNSKLRNMRYTRPLVAHFQVSEFHKAATVICGFQYNRD